MTDNASITITLMSGPQDGLKLSFPAPPLGQKMALIIGRSDSCDIVLSYDSQVSRRHARLTCASNDDTITEGLNERFGLTFTLEDLGSRNGSYLDEQHSRRLETEDPVELAPNQLFRVGRTWLRIDP